MLLSQVEQGDEPQFLSSGCRHPSLVATPTFSLCSVYGDPHLRTFDGRYQTCRVLGTWPLVDNEYLTVQTTNSWMGWGRGTAVSKVTVRLRGIFQRQKRQFAGQGTRLP